MNESEAKTSGHTIVREGVALDVSTMATVYGCCGLFAPCMDNDIMSLSFEGSNAFLDWLGWQAELNCIIRKGFLTWVRPEQGEGCTPGYLADPCDAPYGAEWGGCTFELRDFARLRRHGPVRDVTYNGVKLCEQQPRYRLDGSVITSDKEFDMRIATEVLVQDLARMVITGNAATPGQFDGLQQLVSTGYVDPLGHRCAMMDSIVIDWNANNMVGGNGITWNGNAVANTYDIINVLLATYRRIKARMQMAPALGVRGLSVGDMVLVLPSQMINCLLDFFTCWSVCPGSWETSLPMLNTMEARRYRDTLNGGLYGFGRIYLDGFEVPLIAYDWGLQTSATLGDMYLLTGSVGKQKLINGQYLDMRTVPAGYPELNYTATDGGRLLTWTERDHTCARQNVEIRPRMLMWAPWAQVRFQDVRCAYPGGPLSADPCDSSFYPETSFTPFECASAEPELR